MYVARILTCGRLVRGRANGNVEFSARLVAARKEGRKIVSEDPVYIEELFSPAVSGADPGAG